MSRKQEGFIGGVAILGFIGLLSKVIGLVFRIPLTNSLGTEWLGLYMLVYPTYTMLLSISTAGIPVAISRLVSESVTLGNHRSAKKILRTALPILASAGLILTALMIAFSGMLASQRNTPEIYIGFIALAPSILIVSIMSAFRGYLQGHRRMTPTAISQIIEQAGKLVVSLPLTYLGARKSLVHAAAGTLAGISVSELLALVYVYFMYRREQADALPLEAAQTEPVPSSRSLAKKLIFVAIPITIGSMIMPIASYIDSAMIPRRLATAGFDAQTATKLYGMLTGCAVTLINVPTAMATAICIGLVPTISAAHMKNSPEQMNRASMLGLRMGSLIGFPCAVGMSLLSTEIINLLYRISTDEIAITGRILSLSALTILPFTLVQATTGVLQGVGKQKIPMYSLVAGVACKIVLNYILVAIPSLNVYGAPISSMVCYVVSTAVNLYYIAAKLHIRLSWSELLLRPGVATLGMAAAVAALTHVLNMQRRANTIIAVAFGVVVYFALALAVKAVRRSDLKQVPGGRKLEKLMLKLHLWR